MFFRRSTLVILSVFLIVVLSACNLPGGNTGAAGTPDLALTITALASGQGNNTNTPGAPAGVQETATPQFTATPNFTATPSVPQITVSVDTNCRQGPGLVYDRVGGLPIGQIAEIVGKNSGVPNYWVVKLPNSTVICWLWAEYATVSGNTSNLPEYPVPPTPTPSPTPTLTPTPTVAPPAAASNLVANKICTNSGVPGFFNTGGTITWQDNSNNETGFNIYVGANLNTSVGENVNVFAIPQFLVSPGQPVSFSVEAYNTAGKAAKVNVTFSCP